MKITCVNPMSRDMREGHYRYRPFVLAFGAYGDTVLLAYGHYLEDALDECIDWIADKAPGLLMDDQVAEAYDECIAEGMSEEDAQQEAESDMTIGGNNGHYIASWEWCIIQEEPTRDELIAIAKR